MINAIFITATDTGVGKTVIACSLGLLLKRRGIDVGIMKPFQCSGDDTDLLMKTLDIKDEKELVNPYYASEPLAPYVAFKREKIKIDLYKVFSAYENLKKRHEFLIVEGIGGLLVPIKENYLVCDFIRGLDIPVLIVARAGLGTLNHTLLTQKYALDFGIKVKGVIINGLKNRGLAEKTNPETLKEFLDVPLLGIVPFIKGIKTKGGLKNLAKYINLDALLKDDTSDTPKLAHLDKKYVWHPFTQMKDWQNDTPLIIEESRGNYLKDSQGKWYLDGVSSLWVNLHGHRHPQIDRALKKQINKLAHSTLLGLSNPPAIELAKRLINTAPKGLKKVFYSDNGSTTVEVALKMAYQYWKHKGKSKKNKFIHLDNSYHGDTIGAVSVGGIDLFHKIYQPLLFSSFKVNSVEKLKNVLEKRHASIAALIVEPIVQAAAGIILWPDGALKEMARLCKKYNVLLIADEVATGFGRTGKMFACEHEGVSPDIMCLAKGITGGYLPLAATLTTQNIFNAFLGEYKEQKTFFHGHTYTGNPLACACAIANLKIFQKERTIEKLQPKIKFLSQRLADFKSLRHVADVRQKGLMAGIELAPYSWEEKIGIRVCQEIRKQGIILRPLGNVIVLMPPLSITYQELDRLLDAVYQAICEVTNK